MSSKDTTTIERVGSETQDAMLQEAVPAEPADRPAFLRLFDGPLITNIYKGFGFVSSSPSIEELQMAEIDRLHKSCAKSNLRAEHLAGQVAEAEERLKSQEVLMIESQKGIDGIRARAVEAEIDRLHKSCAKSSLRAEYLAGQVAEAEERLKSQEVLMIESQKEIEGLRARAVEDQKHDLEKDTMPMTSQEGVDRLRVRATDDDKQSLDDDAGQLQSQQEIEELHARVAEVEEELKSKDALLRESQKETDSQRDRADSHRDRFFYQMRMGREGREQSQQEIQSLYARVAEVEEQLKSKDALLREREKETDKMRARSLAEVLPFSYEDLDDIVNMHPYQMLGRWVNVLSLVVWWAGVVIPWVLPVPKYLRIFFLCCATIVSLPEFIVARDWIQVGCFALFWSSECFLE